MKEKEHDNWTPPTPVVATHWGLIEFDSSFSQLSTNGYKIAQKKYLPQGKYPIIDQGQELIGGFTDDAEKVLASSKNSIVFGDHTRCFKLIKFPFAPGADGTKILKPISSIDLKFAYYALQTVRLPNRGYSRHFSFLRKSVLPFCHPNEQKRVVAKIEELFSELDKGVESLKTARAQLKIYRQAVLKHAFEGKLTAQWREDNKDKLKTGDELLERIQKEREARYRQQLANWKILVSAWEENRKEGKKPAKPRVPKKISELGSHDLSKLGSLPDSWFWGKLGQMTCGVGYGTSAKSQVSGKVPVLRMGNIQNSKFDWSDLVYTSDNIEISQYMLNLGDVLFNRTNSPELVGKTAIYQGEQPAIFAGYLIRVNQISSIVKGQYLNYFLNSHTSKQHGNTVKTDGVNQSNINGEKLSNYPFPYCSLLEQSEIVRILEEKLSIIDNTVDELNTELKKSEALRQSILKKAFSGKLVAQDPTDEPASVLLERIKAEKNNKKKKEKAA